MKDECVYNLDQESVRQIEQTNNEIELFLDGKVDLLIVLAACFAISKDRSAQKYSLFTNNCFFFSWMILMVVSRVYLLYNTPPPEQLLQCGDSHACNLTTVIVDEIATLILGISCEIATIVWNKAQAQAGPTIHQALHPLTQLAWSLPIGTIRFSWKQVFHA